MCIYTHIHSHVHACSVAQLYLTVCNPMDCNAPGSSVHGISQARILEGCHFLLQGILPIQGLNPHLLCLLRWQAGSLPRCHPGSPLSHMLICVLQHQWGICLIGFNIAFCDYLLSIVFSFFTFSQALVLCYFLETNVKQYNIADKNVIEIGAGTGLVSIVASLLGKQLRQIKWDQRTQ